MAQPETRYVTVGDAQVAYQVVGDGPIDLLFHHGFCHIDLQWDVASEAGFIRRLAEFSRVILFDRRGSGASERMPLGRFPTWEEWNLDVLAVLDAVGAQRCALFAEAEAGPMGLLFAAAHPERVSALILGNTSARFGAADDYPVGTTTAEAEALVEAIELLWGKPELIEASMPSLARKRGDVDALARLMRAAATPRVAAAQFHHIFSELDARDALPLISMPTLVLTSEGSTTMDANALDRTQYLVDHIPGSRLVRVPGSDSHLFAGDHGPVIGAVAEFLTGQRPMPTSDRFLTTVLFTDIVGSTERAVEVGDRRWRELLDTHDQSVRNELHRFGGREIKTTGDGFLACFDGPARAIDCATGIVRAAQGVGLEVRAGLHTGECERRGDDIAGVAVHIAARVGAHAAPREVLVSRTVTDLVAGSGIGFEDRGEQALKGIPDSWHLFAVHP